MSYFMGKGEGLGKLDSERMLQANWTGGGGSAKMDVEWKKNEISIIPYKKRIHDYANLFTTASLALKILFSYVYGKEKFDFEEQVE